MCNSFDSIYSANRLLWCETSVGVLWFWPSASSMREQTTLIKKSHLAKKRFELGYYIKHSVSFSHDSGWEIGNGDLDLHCLLDSLCRCFLLIDTCAKVFVVRDTTKASVLQCQFLIKQRDFNQNHFGSMWVWITVWSYFTKSFLFGQNRSLSFFDAIAIYRI